MTLWEETVHRTRTVALSLSAHGNHLEVAVGIRWWWCLDQIPSNYYLIGLEYSVDILIFKACPGDLNWEPRRSSWRWRNILYDHPPWGPSQSIILIQGITLRKISKKEIDFCSSLRPAMYGPETTGLCGHVTCQSVLTLPGSYTLMLIPISQMRKPGADRLSNLPKVMLLHSK